MLKALTKYTEVKYTPNIVALQYTYRQDIKQGVSYVLYTSVCPNLTGNSLVPRPFSVCADSNTHKEKSVEGLT